MHVIFLAPHFPASQHKYVRGLKKVGATVTGIGDIAAEHVPRSILEMLDGYEAVGSIADVNAVTAAVHRIQKRGPWVHRLEATIETHVLIAAEVRERTGIPGTSMEATNLCRDKFEMKAFLLSKGIPCAAQASIDAVDDAVRFCKSNGFPVILKPRKGAGAHGTHRIDDMAGLKRVLAAEHVGTRRGVWTMEAFIQGHEGFYDTLTVGGEPVFEAVSHYYPNVLEGMRNAWISPYIVTTNRVGAPGYRELRHFGKQVIDAMGLGTTATHMEWFYGPRGLSFSEIGARPPGVNFWDLYCAANDFDLYAEWARAVCWRDYRGEPSRRYSAGLISLRPNRSGTVSGVSGLDEIQRKYGAFILDAHMPHRGSKTAPVEAGYLAHGWMRVRHPDYDACRAMLDDIGRTVQVLAE